MKHIRIIGLTLVAAFAMSAVAATSALALSHTYSVEKKELLANETREIRSSAATEFTLKGKGALNVEAVTKCKKLKLNAGLHPVIVGGVPGTSKNESIEFEECSATVGGVKCTGAVEIESPATNNELVTIVKPAELAGKLATLFVPASGKVFSKIKLNKCGILGNQTATVEGTTAAFVPSEAESVLGMLAWNEKEEITEIEKQGGAKATVGLTSDSKLATLNGEATVELVSGLKWSAL